MLRALICSVLLVVVLPVVARAEQAPRATLGISPAITEWLAGPGQTLQKTVLVSNATKEPLPVSALVRPFQLQGADRLAPTAGGRYDASSWLTVENGDFILKPGETRKVGVVLAVPKDAPPGGHYATVYFRQLRPAGSAGAQAQVGALAFITVKGEVVKKLESGGIKTQWSGGTLSITATLRNAGNVHIMPEGEFVILNWLGNEVGRVKLPQGMVLPQTARPYQASFKLPGYGVYTVKPLLSYGDNQPLDMPRATVWAVPWKLPFLIMLIVVAGWFGIYRIRHRWKRAFFALTQRKL